MNSTPCVTRRMRRPGACSLKSISEMEIRSVTATTCRTLHAAPRSLPLTASASRRRPQFTHKLELGSGARTHQPVGLPSAQNTARRGRADAYLRAERLSGILLPACERADGAAQLPDGATTLLQVREMRLACLRCPPACLRCPPSAYPPLPRVRPAAPHVWAVSGRFEWTRCT